jgi:hypothetical protein
MAAHCDTAILPARPRRPRDKAKVEVAVLIFEAEQAVMAFRRRGVCGWQSREAPVFRYRLAVIGAPSPRSSCLTWHFSSYR